MITVDGVDHEVTFTQESHNATYGFGEMRADCICKWWDAYPFSYDPATQRSETARRFAVWKLQCSAMDHVPRPEGGR